MSRNLLLHVAERALNRPLLLHPDKAMIVHDVLSGRIGTEAFISAPTPDANRLTAEDRIGGGDYTGLYLRGGTPVVPVIGSLVNRGAWIGADSGLVSYEGIGAMIDRAAGETKTGTIGLDIDSPGGEATGMFALAEQIRAVTAAGIRVVAVVNDMAASAGYGIASAASEIWVSPTSVVGSIGVVMLHLDRSGELAAKGVKPTLIFAGAHKVDGHPFGPLPDNVRADLVDQVNHFYDLFIQTVAAGRGDRLDAEAARATQARVLIGEQAIKAGLADRLGTVADLFATAGSKSAGPQNRRTKMDHNQNGPAATTEAGAITQDTLNQAVATARAEGVSEGERNGRKAERERIGAILNHAAAANKQVTALSLALDTELTVEQATTVLGKAAADAPGLSPEATSGPEIGGNGAGTGAGKPATDLRARLKSAQAERNARLAK